MTNTPMTFEQWYATNFANTNDPYHKRGFENAWQASQAQQASVIAELREELQQLHTGDNLKALLDEDTNTLMESCNEMHKTVLERDKTIAELVEALIDADEMIGIEPFEHVAEEAADAHRNIRELIAKVKGK